MSTLFNLRPPTSIAKPNTTHPWEKTIKDIYANRIKYAHNSLRNPRYPRKEEKHPDEDCVKLSVIGDRITREFIYCQTLVKGLHKYRPNKFDAPIIRAVTTVEWPEVWRSLKVQYGGITHCLLSSVAVLVNDKVIGGEKELKKLVESKYIYHLTLDYYNDAVALFSTYIRSSGRPCAYMQFSINDEPIGTMIFMLYSDILPCTSDNFLRLCNQTKGGYSGTPIHRIVKDGWIQGGGFGLKKSNLDCENFVIPHDKRGVLCMANDGRHVDCSTQFFVLLQPAPWMAHKYVAFGQLIEGAETLEKIESVPTWYESPTSNIVIFKAGIFNMECHDITINKETNQYIHGHIEDLIALGDKLIENLIERVFLEIELKLVQKMEREMMGETEGEEAAADGIHATRRFLRKKEEIEKHIKSQPAPTQAQKSQVVKKEVEEAENNEYDVEEYELEESTYTHLSIQTTSLVVKPEHPYYIPLTDVPYPGERSSTYDLKNFLRGDYCLESDLDPKRKRIDAVQEGQHKNICTPVVQKEYSDSASESNESINSEVDKEIRQYIRTNVDQVSFAGGIIKGIAKGLDQTVFDNTEKKANVTDEELRRMRLKALGIKFDVTRDKKVSISVSEPYEGEKVTIKRRQTGFVRQKDLEKLRMISLIDDDTHNKRVSIHVDSGKGEQSKIKRRQTGFVHRKDIEKLNQMSRESQDKKSQNGRRMSNRRYTDFDRMLSDDDEPTGDLDISRPSVLQRLYDEMSYMDSCGPTLKDFKPQSEAPAKSMLLTFSPFSNSRIKVDEYNRDNLHRRSLSQDQISFENVLNLQHGKKFARKISSDYVKTIDQIEHGFENSIRSIEYAKTRPAMSVSAYQMKNRIFQEEQKAKRKDRELKGIRLPGDTPCHSFSDVRT